MGKANASIKEQIANLQQELQQIIEIGCRDAEEKFKVMMNTLQSF